MATIATSTTEQRKRKRRHLLDAFSNLVDTTLLGLLDWLGKSMRGSATPTALTNGVTDVLMGAHVQAATLGRNLAGASVAPIDNQEFAASVMREQVPFVAGLVEDVAAGRYELADDGSLPPALKQRAELYALRLRGTANEAWVLSLSPNTLIRWTLDPSALHCEKCKEYADGSPYTAATLPTTPGSADCLCLSRCRCELETVDGRGGFVL